MLFKRLSNTSSHYFKEAWELYISAFPKTERRVLASQANILKNSKYHFDIIQIDNAFVGFILWWDFDAIRYVDHFATVAALRNKGLGKRILQEFKEQDDKPILLEVELPDSELNKRRIEFYERIGFILNKHDYQIPPEDDRSMPLQLLIMTYPEMINKQELEQFVVNCHPTLFKN